MSQPCNQNLDVAILRTALANLLAVSNVAFGYDSATWAQVEHLAGIYHSRLVAQEALDTTNH